MNNNTIGKFIKEEALNKKTELNSLYKRPNKEEIYPRFQILKPNIFQQADILYLPEDIGFKYLLVVVDVYDKKIDAIPIKSLKQEDNEVYEGIKKIYSNGILKYPKFLSFDQGNEFKGSNLTDYLKNHRVNVRYSKPGRHRQQAVVESANRKLGTYIHKFQANQELLTGKEVKTWVNELKDLIKYLNENLPPPITPNQSDEILTQYKVHKNIIPINTKVRVILDKPENTYNSGRLSGTFRKSDIRWSRDIKTITNIYLTPNQPVMYQIDNDNSIAYTDNQLQVIKTELKQPNPNYIRGDKNDAIIEKILDSRKVGRKTEYLVKWYGYENNNTNNTWEASKTFDRTKILKDMKRSFIQNQD